MNNETLRAAVTAASSDILKMVMEAMADPEGGIGIDQVEALILGHIEPALADASTERVKDVEQLAREFHAVYQTEAKRQGDVRHHDDYDALPENIKEFDRALARHVLSASRTAPAGEGQEETVTLNMSLQTASETGIFEFLKSKGFKPKAADHPSAWRRG